MLTTPTLEGETWHYPDGWSDDDRRAWEGIQGRKLAETKRAFDVTAAQEAAATSPAAMLAAARAEADESTRARERAERASLGETAWRKAVELHGDRVCRIATVEGDIIIMAAMSEADVDYSNARAANLVANAKGNAIGAHAAFMGAHRDAMVGKVIHPERDRVKALAKKYPGLWADLEFARDVMIRGRRDDEGKEPAL
jgi:hypothetical protein